MNKKGWNGKREIRGNFWFKNMLLGFRILKFFCVVEVIVLKYMKIEYKLVING